MTRVRGGVELGSPKMEQTAIRTKSERERTKASLLLDVQEEGGGKRGSRDFKLAGSCGVIGEFV